MSEQKKRITSVRWIVEFMKKLSLDPKLSIKDRNFYRKMLPFKFKTSFWHHAKAKAPDFPVAQPTGALHI